MTGSCPPKVAQFRLDLRLIAKSLARFFAKRSATFLMAGGARFLLGGFELLAVSALMQIGLALPMAYYFHRVTSMGLVANLLVIPLTDVLMPSAILAVGLGYISSFAAKVPVWIACVSVHVIDNSLQWFGGLRAADLRVPTPTLLTILCSLIALVVASPGILALSGCALFIILVPPKPDLRPGVLARTHCN